MLNDEQIELDRCRQYAAALYRTEGFSEFAAHVEAGLKDDSQGMRLTRQMEPWATMIPNWPGYRPS